MSSYVFISLSLIIPIVFAAISPLLMLSFSILIGPLPLGMDVSHSMGGLFGNLNLDSVRMLGTLIGSIIILARKWQKIPKYIYFCFPHLVFLSFAAGSIVWAPSYLFGGRMFLKLVAPIVFLLAVAVTVDEERKAHLFLKMILVSCFLSATIALVTKLLGVNDDLRLTIPGLSPAPFGANILIGLIVLLNYPTNNRKISKYFGILTLSCLVLAAFTRITIGAMFAVIAIVGIMRGKGFKKLLYPFASASGFVTLFLFVDKFRKRMFFGTESISISLKQAGMPGVLNRVYGSGRFTAWKYVLGHFFVPNLIFGAGLGATQHYYYTGNRGLGVIHSEYVRLLAELGVVGAALFIIALFWYIAVVGIKSMTDENNRTFNYKSMYICAVVSYLIFMATDNAFDYINQFGNYVFALIAMAINYKIGLFHDGVRHKSI